MTARDGITNLMARYTQALDDGRTDDIVATFVADGTFEIVGTVAHTGSDALRAAYDSWAPRVPQRHVVSSILITEDGTTRATATSDFTFFVKSDAAWSAVAVGRYADELVCVDGEWRFAARRATFS